MTFDSDINIPYTLILVESAFKSRTETTRTFHEVEEAGLGSAVGEVVGAEVER